VLLHGRRVVVRVFQLALSKILVLGVRRRIRGRLHTGLLVDEGVLFIQDYHARHEIVMVPLILASSALADRGTVDGLPFDMEGWLLTWQG